MKVMSQQKQKFIQQGNLTVRELCRWIAARAIYVVIAVLAAIGWSLWDNRDQAQINRILIQSPQLVKLAAIDRERFENVEAWLGALVIAGKLYGALGSAREIGDVDLRSRAMTSIVGALGRAGKTDEALPVANEALESARKINGAGYRSQAMVGIVEVLGKVGKTDEALGSAREIEDAGYRSQAMVIVAEEMIKNRDVGKAKGILDEAQYALQQATKDSEKSARLAAVAMGLAKLHHYYLARDIADLCASSNQRLAAYTAIFRQYLIKQNPGLEKLFDDEKHD